MFGDGLKRKRKELDLSQEELAVKSGVPQSTISAVESGKRIPKEDTMVMIAAGLECTVGDLLGEKTIEEKSSPQNASELDQRIINLASSLSSEDFLRVEDFVQGLKAARKEPPSPK